MTLSTQYLALVREMRKAQKTYFATKSNLPECQLIEAKVDNFDWKGERQDAETYKLVALVRDMRSLQRQFFAIPYGEPKRRAIMGKAMTAEKAVDRFHFGASTQSTLF